MKRPSIMIEGPQAYSSWCGKDLLQGSTHASQCSFHDQVMPCTACGYLRAAGYWNQLAPPSSRA